MLMPSLVQEDIALAKPNTTNMTSAERSETKKECGQLENHFKALHKTWEKTSEKQSQLSGEMARCKQVCDERLDTAKSSDAHYKSTLAEELRNLERLAQVDRESNLLHKMTLEQIKVCSDQVEYSQEQTGSRITCIRTEIERLQNVEQQEKDRLQRLAECKKQIDEVKDKEKKLEEASSNERERAKKNAAERVKRAAMGVKSCEDLLKRLETLYQDVQLEFADALGYGTEVLKAIGVDCHAAYLAHGKYLTIEREIAKKNLADFEKIRVEKLETWNELDRRQMTEVQATVDRADVAKSVLKEAEDHVRQIDDTIKNNSTKRQALVGDFLVVDAFLRQHASSSTNGQLLIKTVPMAEEHLAIDAERVKCCNVAEFRQVRDKATAIGHNLELLEACEADIERRFRGETAGNIRSMFNARNSYWGLGRLIGQ